MPTSDVKTIVSAWLESCRRNKKISRNTVAVGLVILDRLRQETIIEKSSMVSDGGEISGARAGLPKLLVKYGLPETFLKEATTRQVHQDGQRLLDDFEYGKRLRGIEAKLRDKQVLDGVDMLLAEAKAWLNRQNIKVSCARHHSPANWITTILAEAKGKSGGKVEQHLVGAKLEQRLPTHEISNHPGHAGDVQTGRSGDFTIGSTCFHVTAAPSSAVIEKCKQNANSGLHPVLLVPRELVDKSRHLAEDSGIADSITILSIEDFIGSNIIEMAVGKQQDFYVTMQQIIERYNRRLQEVETDHSLKIEIK